MNANQYNIIHKIGEGGMGTVYLAEDVALERQVAIKELNKTAITSGEMTENRFQQEALALARLNHPNITHLYAFLPQQNTWWMVMEYVSGKTLEDWLAIHKKFSPQLACGIAVQILDGLRHAHKKGIIHRDLKPANIMVSEDGEVKIMDFGIARIRHSQRITRHGKSVGTLAYMAPEQIQGQEGDERTDIYAVGNILYEMLCGQTPFANDTDYHLMKAKLEQQAPSLSSFSHSASPALQKVILKTLDKNPTKRFESVEMLREALEKSTPNILNQQQLIHQLNHPQPQQLTTVSEKPVANHLPEMAKDFLQKIKTIPTSSNVKWKRPNNATLLLAASVILCIILLIWNHSLQNNNVADSDNLAAVNQDTITTSQSEGLIENELQQYNQPSSGLKTETPKEQPSKEQTVPPPSDESGSTKKEKQQKKVPENPDKQPVSQSPIEKQPAAEQTPAKTDSYNGPVDIPAGRSISLVLDETLSSENKERDGDRIRLRSAETVEVNGRTIIRIGALAEGKIVDVIPSDGRKRALIGFVITHIEAVDGTMLKLASERFRNMASGTGTAVYYQKGQRFTAELKRGRLR